MHKIVPIAICSIASLVAIACSSEYHPEYHPVTVSNFQQDLAYPVTVNNGGATAERAPVYVVPGQAVTAMPAPYVMAPAPPPPGFFAPQ